MKRRAFIKSSALTGAGIISSNLLFGNTNRNAVQSGKRIGIIGLDTSHAPNFTKSFNSEVASPDLEGYKIVAAYPYGSKTIESSYKRIPGYIEDVKKDGVEIVDSIADLLKRVDTILLLTNDGHPHLEQAIQVFKAGKRMFIDKPIAGTLSDAYAIFQAAEDYKQPVFSASGMRYTTNMDDIVKNKIIGNVYGAETYGPAPLEPSHPDFFWYGIHGIEALCTMMGTGCQTVSRVHTPNTDVVVGLWEGNRVGTYRGRRAVGNIYVYGGNAFGQKGVISMGAYMGNIALEKEIVKYFQSGISPVSPEETLEIYTFMEAADESKRRGGAVVSMAETKQKAIEQIKKNW